MLLFSACWLVPRTWQDRTRRSFIFAANWTDAWKFGGERRRARLRARLMDRNPVTWLACRSIWQKVGIWVLALAGVAGFLWESQSSSWSGASFGFVEWPTLLIYLWTAAYACRFFVEARRSGLMELLLSSPLPEGEIVRGWWRAWLRLFAPPLALLLAVQLVGSSLAQISMRRMLTQTPSTLATSTTTQTNSSGTVTVTVSSGWTSYSPTNAGYNPTNAVPAASSAPDESLLDVLLGVLLAVISTSSTAANLLALCWFGMWMGLVSRTTHIATLKTILFVQVIPWFVIMLASVMIPSFLLLPGLVGTGANTSWMAWWPSLIGLISGMLTLTKDAAFVVWSRQRLFSRFRSASITAGAGRRAFST